EPWAYAKTCGWNFTDTPNYEIYNVDFMVKNTEKVGVGKDGYPLIRTNQHALKMIVRFQKSIWLFATITSFSNINPLFAITKQMYDTITSTAILELTSQLPYLFNYTSPTIILLPCCLSGVYTENSDPLDCLPSGICTQKWTHTLTIPVGN